MARRGIFQRKAPTAAPPDGVTNEILTIVQAVKLVDTATAIDVDTLEVVRADGSTVRSSITELRSAIKGTTGLDRFELIEDYVREVSRPVAADDDGLLPVAEIGPAPGEPFAEEVPFSRAAPVAEEEPPGPEPEPQPEPLVDVEATSAPPAASHDDEPTAANIATWESASAAVRPGVAMALTIPPGALRWRIAGSLSLVATVGGDPVTETDAAIWGSEPLNIAVAAMEWLTASVPILEPLAPDMRAWIVTTPPLHQAAWLAHPVALLDIVGLPELIAFAATPTDLVVIDPADVDAVGAIRDATSELLSRGEVTLSSEAYVLSRDNVRLAD